MADLPAEPGPRQLAREVNDLRRQVADLDAALELAVSAREADARRLREHISGNERELRAARQDAYAQAAAHAVTAAALEAAEAEIEQLSADLEAGVRELRAERRQRELELELEWVTRRAAEFQYGVGVALRDSLKVLERLSGRVREVLARDSAGPDPSAEEDLARFDQALDRLRSEIAPRDEPAE